MPYDYCNEMQLQLCLGLPSKGKMCRIQWQEIDYDEDKIRKLSQSL